MTEDEARALLRNVRAPMIPPAGLTGTERDWIAAQPWRETPRGWHVDGHLGGTLFHVDVEPGVERRALYIVRADLERRENLGVWLEPPGDMDAPLQDATAQPYLEVLGTNHVAIVKNGRRALELTGGNAARIAGWYQHMQTHGADWAAAYLAGVIDGLGHPTAQDLQRAVERARNRP